MFVTCHFQCRPSGIYTLYVEYICIYTSKLQWNAKLEFERSLLLYYRDVHWSGSAINKRAACSWRPSISIRCEMCSQCLSCWSFQTAVYYSIYWQIHRLTWKESKSSTEHCARKQWRSLRRCESSGVSSVVWFRWCESSIVSLVVWTVTEIEPSH